MLPRTCKLFCHLTNYVYNGITRYSQSYYSIYNPTHLLCATIFASGNTRKCNVSLNNVFYDILNRKWSYFVPATCSSIFSLSGIKRPMGLCFELTVSGIKLHFAKAIMKRNCSFKVFYWYGYSMEQN